MDQTPSDNKYELNKEEINCIFHHNIEELISEYNMFGLIEVKSVPGNSKVEFGVGGRDGVFRMLKTRVAHIFKNGCCDHCFNDGWRDTHCRKKGCERMKGREEIYQINVEEQ